MSTVTLSAQEAKVIKDVIEQYQNTGVFLIDSSNEQLKSFYEIQLKLAGLNALEYNAFFNTWNQYKQSKNTSPSLSFASKGSVNPVHSIISLDSSDGKNYETAAISSLPIPAINVTQTLGLFDESAEAIGKVNFNKSYKNTANCVLNAKGQSTEDINNSEKAITVIYTFSQTIDNQTIYGAEIITTQSYPKQITNVSPKDINENNEIKICLTRDAKDCDYRHSYGGHVSIPVQGNISYLDKIDTKDGKPVNGKCAIYLIRERDGGNPITPLDSFNFFDHANTKIDDNKLSWNLDWLQFKQPDFNSGEMVYYIFQVLMQIDGKKVASFITNAPKSILPDQRFLNTITIKPMQIVYGCLGKNTLITMKDGSEKPIAKVETGDWVKSQDDRYLRVEDVITGQEKHYYEITLADAGPQVETLTTSLGHPFCTSDGILLAQELSETTRLFTENSQCAISKIEKKEGEIDVFNLHLSTDNPGKDLTNDNRTMYANKVLVGDSVMQRTYEDLFNQQPENVLKALPEAWQQDFIAFQKTK